MGKYFFPSGLLIFLCILHLSTEIHSLPAVSPSLYSLITSKPGTNVNLLLSMTHGSPSAALAEIKSRIFPTRSDKLQAVYSALKSEADSSQKEVLNFLSLHKESHDHIVQLWISNQIIVKKADHNLLRALSSREDISKIEAEIYIEPSKAFGYDPYQPQRHYTRQVKEDPWGVGAIGASTIWGNGTTGEGVVVGTIDTGVRWTHEAVRDNYKNDDYSWYEPDEYTTMPHDGSWHGTHTLAIIVGAAGGIGVAPGAQWMSCKWCQEDAGPMCTDHKLLECGQFMLCPTKHDGTDPDCSQAPHLVSNSWAWGSSPWYNDVLDAWRAADIIPVFAIGNSGPGCSSTVYPGLLQSVISVGATKVSGELSDFSSIGPNEDGERRPDISAPGTDIPSASSDGDDLYMTMSGTSMSTPHAAGLVALILSRQPGLTFDEVRSLLEKGAVPLGPRGTSCGSLEDSKYPNNHAGYGLINAPNTFANM